MKRETDAPISVLVADDHEPTRVEIRRALESDRRFHVCAEAADSASAVAGAVRERPDICLLDIRMPGDGLAAAWEIHARLPNCRLVMLTVSDVDRDVMVALQSGVAGYLLKSIDRRRLALALWDIYRGTFTMPRELMGRVVDQMRDTAPRRRSVELQSGERLTSREWEVLDLLASGLSTREVADKLSLSPTGVRVHTASAVKKLGARDRQEAIEVFGRARSS